MNTSKLKLAFECETSDPDDFLTLLWLVNHPQVDLQAVLITPGGRDQCQLVRWALDTHGRSDVPIGTFHSSDWWLTAEGQKQRVSGFHYKVYGDAPRTYEPGRVRLGCELVVELLRREPELTYLCGAAPKNLGGAFRQDPEVKLARWVQQGFFAGDNLVAAPLPKFKGKRTCPSWNPGGDPKSCLELLASPRIARRVAVSKNVCHGVVWTSAMHARLAKQLLGAPHTWAPGFKMMIYGLECYLRDKGVGKAMHDIVAAATCLDEAVVGLTAVDIYRERGEWGATAAEVDTRTWISTAFDEDRFLATLAAGAGGPAWTLDRLDGKGPSGVTLDVANTRMLTNVPGDFRREAQERHRAVGIDAVVDAFAKLPFHLDDE